MQTVLTTGANSGIGLATVLDVARHGFRSIGTVRSEAKADVVRKAAADAGVEVETIVLDVTDADACVAELDGLELYGLVNNAGYSNAGAVEDVTDEEARHQLETMTIAPMRLARLALPAMRANRVGRIINVSSIAGRSTTPLAGWYQASKHALEAVSDALRMEVAGDNVKVVLVEPGGFKTGIWEDMERAVDQHEGSRFDGAYRRSLQMMKLTERIMGDPAQVAKVIVGVLKASSPRARYLVGIDAQALALTDRITPTTIKDRVLRLALGI